MDQVLIQLVMDDQGEVSLEYLADLVRRLPPEKIEPRCWPTWRPSWTRTRRSCRPASRRASCPRGWAGVGARTPHKSPRSRIWRERMMKRHGSKNRHWGCFVHPWGGSCFVLLLGLPL